MLVAPAENDNAVEPVKRQAKVDITFANAGDFCVQVDGPPGDMVDMAEYVTRQLRSQYEAHAVITGGDDTVTGDGITCDPQSMVLNTEGTSLYDSTGGRFWMPTSSAATTTLKVSNYDTTGTAVGWNDVQGWATDAITHWFDGAYYSDGNDCWKKYSRTPSERLREIIRSRKAPGIIIRQNDRRKPMPTPKDVREQRARETMRRVLGEREYRRFMSKGFVSIRAKSGRDYQIFPGHGVTCVFQQGLLVERLCVVLRGNFCPTDSLMMRYLMILNDEDQFRSFAIMHSLNIATFQQKEVDERPLLEIFKEFKEAAA